MSELVKTFVELTMKDNIFDIGMKMEAYMLSRVQKEATNTKTISQMYYHNFDLHITAKYGVVIRNWPLKTFCVPSKISFQVELNILLNAWRTDIAQFYKMSCDEFKAWKTQQFNDALTNNVNGSVGSVSNPSSAMSSSMTSAILPSTASAPTTGSHVNTDGPMPTPLPANIVNMVFSGDGAVVFVTKKPHKVRKDKGVKHKNPTNPETISDV
ncbi:hypothetical protein C0993_001460 [Termitomyces sp. T159_Od127]|nr:hypothetical protein C0993_001460 [Termitomyces sp. T159_Od127]